MALPKAAQKQLEAAQKMHEQAYPAPEENQDKPNLEVVSDGKPEDAAQPPTKVESDEAQPDGVGKENDPAFWKHKYDVLQGKYDAEVPRLQQSNNGLQGRLGEMENQLARITAKMADAPAKQITPSSYLTDEEREDYGEDMLTVVKKAAREEFEPMLATLQEENGQLRSLLGGMQQKSILGARDEMLDKLDNELSNWRQLNSQPDFLGWLENVDPYSGNKKLEMLRQAFENNNTSRVLAFFKGFLNENAAYTSNSQVPNQPREVGFSLETLVAPGRASDSEGSRAQEGNANSLQWSSASIKKFYSDINRGVYRDKPDERTRLERDLFSAQEEGRIAS